MNQLQSSTRNPRHTGHETVARIPAQPVAGADEPVQSASERSKLLRFIEELRRRKVCRALTLYAVALWLITQVVDLAYQHLGLPDWTLRLVVVLGLVGLPVSLFLSWLMELTPDGLVRDSRSSARVTMDRDSQDSNGGRIVDWCLLVAAIAIAANLAWATMAGRAALAGPDHGRIAVAAFEAGAGDDAPALTTGLASELRHALASRAKFRVIASRDPYGARNCLTLTGSLSIYDGILRVTVALVDNETMEVVRTEVVEWDRGHFPETTAAIARDIVTILDSAGEAGKSRGTRHDG